MVTVAMKDVFVAHNPLFIPNLNSNHHKAITKVLKREFNPNVGHHILKLYEVMFWGWNAEVAALSIVKGDRLNLEGHLKFHSRISNAGKRKGKITLFVTGASFTDGRPYNMGEFDYSQAAITGKFGNARVYVPGVGFLDKRR